MKMKWRKKERTGRHLAKIGGIRLTVLPGDTIEATVAELGNQISQYEQLTFPGVTDEQIEEVTIKTPIMVKIDGTRNYNVVNPDAMDSPLNSKPLSKRAAAALISSMSKEDEE
jgi:hypothetical protein